MPNQILRRRGNEAQTVVFTGGTGETTFITDNIFLAIHNSSQLGGFIVPKLTANKRILDNNGIVFANSTTTLNTTDTFTWTSASTLLSITGTVQFVSAASQTGGIGSIYNVSNEFTIRGDTGGLRVNNAANSTNNIILTDAGAMTIRGNLTVSGGTISATGAFSGATPEISVTNTSNTASSSSVISATVGGSSAGDPYWYLHILGIVAWYGYVDNSDSDKFKLGTGAPSGGTALVTVDTSGNVGIGTTAPAGKLELASSVVNGQNLYITKTDSGTTDQNGGSLIFQNFHAIATGRSAGVIAGAIPFYFSQPSSGAAQLAAQIQAVAGVTQTGLQVPTDLVFSTASSIDSQTAQERVRISYLGNVGIGTTVFGTSAATVLGIGNGTEPSTSPADMIQLYSVDLSAGNATLGLRTETAVAVDVVLASTHTLSVRINGTTYKILLST